MKKFGYVLLFAALVCFVGCENKEEVKDENTGMSIGMHQVKVLDKLDASGYSYLQVSENDNTFWIAVPQMEVGKGETLYFSKSMEMIDFKSESLDRTFPSVLFVEDITRNPNVQKDELSNIHTQAVGTGKQDIKIEPLPDGLTIEKIFEKKESLSGQVIKVRGKVIKINIQIMNRNWIHLQDGTGSKDNFDLMVTSQDKVEVGQVVIAEGKVTANKDFGSGYSYAVLLEEAKVTPDK